MRIEVGLFQPHKGALSLASVFQKCPDNKLLVISSNNGQVVYFSLLETMMSMLNCTLECRVYQGRLSHEGQYDNYTSGEPSNLAGVLLISSLPESTTTPLSIHEKTLNYMVRNNGLYPKKTIISRLHLALDVGENFSLDPRSFIQACASTVILSECLQPCVLLEAVQDEIMYYGAIRTAVKCMSPYLLCVITGAKIPIDILFVQTAMTKIEPGSLEFDGVVRSDIIVTETDDICLPCAYRRALDILQEMFEGQDNGKAREILIAGDEKQRKHVESNRIVPKWKREDKVKHTALHQGSQIRSIETHQPGYCS